jgi:hypothetical protein
MSATTVGTHAAPARSVSTRLRTDPAFQAFTLLRVAFTGALRPRYGALLVAAWLGGIVINLLTYSGFYDIALRDFGLILGALTPARLATVYDR